MALDQELLKQIGNVLAEGTQSVLPMLLPKPVEVSIADVKPWQPQAFPDPMVLMTTNFTEGPTGSAYFLILTKHASIIVDLMLGGEGADDRAMNEESVDALKEVMNQILGVVVSSLRDNYDTKLAIDQVEVHSLEAEMDLGLLLDDADTTMFEQKLEIEGFDPIIMASCFPDTSLSYLTENIGKTTDKAAAPAPEAPAATKSQEAAGAPEDEQPTVQAVPTDGEPAEVPVGQPQNIGLIMDLELPVVIRLGTSEMNLKEIMRLGPGAILELSKAVDDPVELLVNNQIIASGEVVVVDGNFAFRVTEIESKSRRIKSLV